MPYFPGISPITLDKTNGRVGVNNTAPAYSLDVTATATDPSSQQAAFFGLITTTLTANNAINSISAGGIVDSRLNQNGFDANGSSFPARGIVAISRVTGTGGTVSGQVGNFTVLMNTGAGTVSSAYGFAYNSYTNSGGGTVVNNYGYRVESQTVGTNIYGFYGNIAAASGRYNAYMAGTAQNYFAGLTGFGVTVPTAMMHAAASSTARASICKPHGSAPTSPVNGDEWTTTAGSFVQVNGATKTYVLVSSPATYTPSNVTTDRTYDANATTLDEVADVLGTLIADLKLTGIIL